MKIVSCFSKNTPTEGRFRFLQEKRKSSLGPGFHPPLAVSWFWPRERLCLNICPWRGSGLDYGSVHRCAGWGGCSQWLALWVGEDDARLYSEGKFTPYTPHGGKRSPFHDLVLPTFSLVSLAHVLEWGLFHLHVYSCCFLCP